MKKKKFSIFFFLNFEKQVKVLLMKKYYSGVIIIDRADQEESYLSNKIL